MELIINGIKADLFNSQPAITKESVDVENPSNRFIDYTNSFILPDTETNRKIFESPNVIGSNNRSFDKLYNVSINDVFKIFSGKGFLDSSNRKEFSFQAVDNSRELFDAIDIRLKEISWDDKDTTLTTASIDSLDSADLTNCWFWGKACLHQQALQINTDQTTGDARCKYSRPSLYVNALLKRAIENNGYSFNSPSPDLAISPWHEKFYFTSYQKTLNGTYSTVGTLALSGLNTNDFSHSDLTVTSTTINVGTKETIFRLRGTVEATSSIAVIFKATDNGDPAKIKENKFLLPSSGEIDYETSEYQSDTGMTIDIRFEGTGDVDFTNTLLYTLISDDTEDLSNNPFLNYRIKAYDNMPDLTYKDLFRTVCLLSNQYHIVDNYKKTFSFETLANLNKNNTVNWSDKFIIDSFSIKSEFKNLFKKNYLRYSNDLTVNKDLGQHYFLTDNEKLQDEGNYITVNFSASNEVTINSNDIAHINIYSNSSRIADQDISMRIFEINGSRLTFSGLDWKNISENYYKNWFNSLRRIRVVEAEFNLKKLDVINWKENQLVYVDYFKTIFLVLKISNFIPRRKTKVKLLAYGR